VYSKYLNRFRAGGGGEGIKINHIPEASSHKIKQPKDIQISMDNQIPQLNKIYNKNVVAVGHNVSGGVGISRNTKTNAYNTEVIS
jgi:transcription termination factor Rho